MAISITWQAHPTHPMLVSHEGEAETDLCVLTPEQVGEQTHAEVQAQIEGWARTSESLPEFLTALQIEGYLTHERYELLMERFEPAYRAAKIVYAGLPSRVVTSWCAEPDVVARALETQGEVSDRLMDALEAVGLTPLQAAVIAESITGYLGMFGGRFGNLDAYTEVAGQVLNAALGGQQLNEVVHVRPEGVEVTVEALYAMCQHVLAHVPEEG